MLHAFTKCTLIYVCASRTELPYVEPSPSQRRGPRKSKKQASVTDVSQYDSVSPDSDSSLDPDEFLRWSAGGVSRHSEERSKDAQDTMMEPPIEVLRDSRAHRPDSSQRDEEDEDMYDAAPEIDELADDDDSTYDGPTATLSY